MLMKKGTKNKLSRCASPNTGIIDRKRSLLFLFRVKKKNVESITNNQYLAIGFIDMTDLI